MELEQLEEKWQAAYPSDVPRHLKYPEISLDAMLRQSGRELADQQALLFLGSTWTWRQLSELAGRWATTISSLGIARGERVMIMLPNCPQAVCAFYGTLWARAVAVMVNPLYVEREITEILTDSGASLVLALDRLAPRLDSVLREHPQVKVIYTHITDLLPAPKRQVAQVVAKRHGQWKDVPPNQSWRHNLATHTLAVQPVNPEELAALQYTGGTTGTPKAVMLSHRNLMANAVQTMVWSRRKPEAGARVVGVLPFFHVYGMTVAMNLALVSGAALIAVPRFDAKELADALIAYRPRFFPATPTMYVAVTREATGRQLDLSFISACISGSAPLPLAVQEEFEALTHGYLVEGYGLSEASPVTHCNPLSERRKVGTVGIPFPDTDGVVVNEHGRIAEAGERGEIWVRGPQVMLGYWQRPEETAAVITSEGWLKTGDIGELDEDGFLQVVDRQKDLIIAGGYNIYPREVEEVLYRHPGVAEAAVFGVPDAYLGQTVRAAVVAKEDAHLSEAELRAYCETELARYKVPRSFEVRASLPKSVIGKILKRVLTEQFQQATEEGKH
ncbi:MAG: long-chain-fatty-acid--CoA ligase [Sulfobacillus sp.]